MIAPFKRRGLRLDQPVEVYRNLHRGGYSVRQGGLVVGHADAIMIGEAVFVVNEAGHRRMLREGVRNVHAWVRGRVIDSCMGTTAAEADGMPRVRYDKRRGAFMSEGLATPPRPLKGAVVVALNERGAFFAYGN